MNTSILEQWATQCCLLATDRDHEAYYKTESNSRRFKRLTLTFFNWDNKVSLNDFTYQENTRKMAQLHNYYYNEVSFLYAKQFLEKATRDCSVGISLQGNRKTFTKQDYCMQSMVINKYGGEYEVQVFHRNTELVKKFGADLAFISVLLGKLNIKPRRVDFYLMNAQLNAVFFPIVLGHYHWEFTSVMKDIKKVDPKFYTNIVKWSYRFIIEKKQKYRMLMRMEKNLHRVFQKAEYDKYTKFIGEEYDKKIY